MKYLLSISLAILATVASPAPSLTGPMLSKRSNPVISDDLDKQFKDNAERVKDQLMDAFQDACSLAKVARDHVNKDWPIYQKYFPQDPDAERNVKKIFNNIIGDDTSSWKQRKFKETPEHTPKEELQAEEPCADMLKQITIVPDYQGGFLNRFACEQDEDDDADLASTMAESRDCTTRSDDTSAPKIIVCDTAVAHGGIDKEFKVEPKMRGVTIELGPDKVTCESITVDDAGGRTTWRMEMLGSIILHEYMHWADFTVATAGPLGTDMTDGDEDEWVYGPYRTQQRKKDFNSQMYPDIYVWFALEAFWHTKCQKHFDLAEKDDDRDPLCNKDTCKDPGSNPDVAEEELSQPSPDLDTTHDKRHLVQLHSANY